MAAGAGGTLRHLEPLETRDPFLRRAMEALAQTLAHTDDVDRMGQVQLYVVDYRFAPAALTRGRYFTANCAALRDENAIVVSEIFLLETEAALRSFDQAATVLDIPYLRSDDDLSGLVTRIRPDPRRYVERLRRLAQLSGGHGAEDDPMVGQFAMLLLFFVGHELGHLDQGHDERAFGSFVEPGAPLEQRLDNAVLKLCRHAREFDHFGFGLPGFERALDEGSEIGASARAFREAMEDVDRNHAHWFGDETSADHHAAELVQQYLDHLAAEDPLGADRRLQQIVRALFAAALYQWQRDLGLFTDQLGMGRLGSAHELVVAMMRNREQYIYAASLFGDVHRFTLLRAVLAIDQWLHARGWIDVSLAAPLGRRAAPITWPDADRELRADCVHRSLLLRIHLDTAVKMAHVGCSTGWLKEKDVERGSPQLLMMQFETIAQSVNRLRRMLQRSRQG